MFNKKLKKQIAEVINSEIECRNSQIDLLRRIEKLEQRKGYLQFCEPAPTDSMEYMLGKYLRAIMDYLEIDISPEFEEDPSYMKPQPIMRKVYRAYKIKKKSTPSIKTKLK